MHKNTSVLKLISSLNPALEHVHKPVLMCKVRSYCERNLPCAVLWHMCSREPYDPVCDQLLISVNNHLGETSSIFLTMNNIRQGIVTHLCQLRA